MFFVSPSVKLLMFGNLTAPSSEGAMNAPRIFPGCVLLLFGDGFVLVQCFLYCLQADKALRQRSVQIDQLTIFVGI